MDDLARRVAAIQGRREYWATPMTVTLAGALFAGLFALIGWAALETQANGKEIVALQKDVASLQTGQTEIKEGLGEVKEGLGEVKEGLAKLQAGQEALGRQLDRMAR